MSWAFSAQADSFDQGVLILEVRENGKHSPRLAELLEKQLALLNIEIRPGRALTTQQRSCRDVNGCLPTLARQHHAARLVWVSIDNEPPARRYLEARGYDVVKDQALDDEPLSCPQERVEQALVELTQKLLSPPPVIPPQAARPEVTAKVVFRPLQLAGLPVWRKGLGIAFAVLGTALLGTAVGLTVLHNGNAGSGCAPPMSMVDSSVCIYNNTSAFAASYSAAGLLALGSGLTLGLPF